MAGKEGFFEFVVDVVCGGILVGVDLVYHDTFFHLYLLFGEDRGGGKFQEQRHCFAQVFLEYGGMENYLFLGSERIEVSSKAVEIAVDHMGALASGALEDGMFGEMCYPAVVSIFIAGPALDRQGAIADGIPASLDGILQPAGGLSDDHYFLSWVMARRSLSRKPLPLLAEILCFLNQYSLWLSAPIRSL